MKKRFALLTMLLVMLCGTISAADYDFHVGRLYYRIILGNDLKPTTNVEVVKGDEEYNGDIVIPQSITISNIEYTVTRIGSRSFADCPNLTSITFPSGINGKLTVIESNAFQNCKGITSLVIPNTVTLIDSYAFIECSGLKNVTIGKGVKEIGNAAFWYCSSLERVDISELSAWCEIKFIQYAGYLPTCNPLFYAKHLYLDGMEVTELNVPDKTTKISGNSFYNCEGLTSVNISNAANVMSIEGSAFYNCTNITSVTLNKNLQSIGAGAFCYCNLESIIIPENVVSIGEGAFGSNSNLKEVTFGNSIEVIDRYAFSGTAITQITVPEKIKDLNGFRGSKLSIVNIGKTSLTDISGPNLPIDRINITDLASFMEIKKDLGGYDLYLNGNLVEDISVPSSITNIGQRSMYGCKSLKTLTIPSHVETADDRAFDGCQAVEKVTFEGGSPKIGSSFLGSFVYNHNVYFVSKMQTPSEAPYALAYDTKRLHILCVPAGCKDKYEAAEGWKEFRYIVEASGPEEAFMDRGNLYCIYGDEVTLVKGGYYAYWNYYLPETTTYQGKTYPITAIDCVVYEGFSPNIVIYASVKSIAEKAFASCTGVQSVTSYLRNPFAINSNVFSDEVKQTITLRVPYGTKAKYQATEGWKEFINIEEMEPEPSESYVVYNDYTLTFYCDDQRSSRIGTTYSLNEGEKEPDWVLDDNNRNVEKVVFDASFAKARPTSTFQWFFYCDFLTEIKGIENLNTSEVRNMRAMFFSCRRLKSIDVSHFDTKAVEDMGGMFSNCTNLENINVSHFNTSNVYNMASMFNECQSLTDLDLSNFNTGKAGYLPYIFSGCSNLRTLYLGSGFTSANDVSCEEAFADCQSLSKVVFTGDIPASINSKFFEGVGTAVAPATLVVQEQYKANYQAKFDGNMFYGGYFTILADNASALEDGDIFTAKTVEGVEMTFKVISAKDKTVQVGTGEENTSAVDKDYAGTLTIPEEINGYKVVEIASHAFSYCNFSDIALPSGLIYIDTEAFYLCESLKSIRIPSSLQNMSVVAFVSCTSVESIVVEEGNAYFDSREGCNAIIRKDDKTLIRGCKNSFIPSGVERINFAAFQQTPLVGSFVIPEGVTYIGQSAFVSATMSSISLPSTLTYIGGLSFQNCNGIESVAIPEGVTYIGNYAFSFCDKLNRVTIPASVTEIGEKAFIGSTQLKTIVSYLKEPCAIADNVFMINDLDDGNNSLINATLYVPFGTKTIYENTDGWKNFKNIVELNATVGDVTGDGEVTKEDITEVATEILEPSTVFDPNKDVNRDGVVNVADIVEGNNIRNSQEQAK